MSILTFKKNYGNGQLKVEVERDIDDCATDIDDSDNNLGAVNEHNSDSPQKYR